MVSKTSATDAKAKSASGAAKKTVSKSTAKKVSAVAAKTTKAKLVDKQVPVKENVNPVEKVLEIKAKNEDKKATRKAAKNAPAKSVAVKKEAVAEKKCCGECKKGICAAWARAYRNMFNFKSRTSRYEFWGFILLNFIFAIVIMGALVGIISIPGANNVVTAIGFGGIIAFILIEFFTYLTLIVRRLHDTGNSAWKGFFRPAILSAVLIGILLVGCADMVNRLGTDIFSITMKVQLAISAYLLLCLLVAIYTMYYFTKIVVISSFFDEDEDNLYGKAYYNDKCSKVKAFKYVVIYCTLVTVVKVISEYINSYITYGQF